MKTYQDLISAGGSEQAHADFALAAISQHQSSTMYKKAAMAQLYKDGLNPTIMHLEKIIYDAKARAHQDVFSPNHKIASSFFGFVVDQEVSYLLSNGITFKNPDAVTRALGKDFSEKAADACAAAATQGVSFTFFNLDHIEVFKLAGDSSTPSFVPLLDTETGLLMGGVRYWSQMTGGAMRFTIYEPDGYTEYIRPKNGRPRVYQPKRDYVVTVRSSPAGGSEVLPGHNYDRLPIVPFAYDDRWRSELEGKKNTIDAMDLVTSKLVNNVDQGNLIYWVLRNCNAMDDVDDAQTLFNILTTKIIHADGDDGADAEPHSIEAPFAGTENAIETLSRRLYTDFQAFDSAAVTAGNQTATAIRAAYVPLDLKADKLERQVTQWVRSVLALVGIDDDPSYTRNRVINASEDVQTVLSAAEYLDREYITRKVLTILGDADQADAVLARMDAEAADRYKQMEEELEEARRQQFGNPGQFGGGEEE